jgi:hypothetical protein
MNNKQELKEERDKIVKGLEETYKRLIEYKKKINRPLIIFKNGKIQAVDPNELPSTTIYKR